MWGACAGTHTLCAAWLSDRRVGLDQRSYSTPGPVSTGMGAGKPPTTSVCNQPRGPTQPSTPSGTENEYRPKGAVTLVAAE